MRFPRLRLWYVISLLALALSATALAFGVPTLLIAPIAGAWADRHDRKRIMIIADLLRTNRIILEENLERLKHLQYDDPDRYPRLLLPPAPVAERTVPPQTVLQVSDGLPVGNGYSETPVPTVTGSARH